MVTKGQKNKRACRVWTREAAAGVVSKYKTLKQFRDENGGLHNAIKKNGWIDLLANLERCKMTWTRESAKAVVDQYTSYNQFYKEQRPLWKHIRRRGWQDLLTSLQRAWKTWTREEIAALVKNYKTLPEFRKNEDNAYQIARRRGWGDLLEPLERKGVNPSDHLWTRDMVRDIVNKCSCYNEFRCKYPKAYAAVSTHHWQDLTRCLPRRLPHKVDHRKWSVYRWLFPEEHAVYIGLSVDVKRRAMQELRDATRSAVKPFLDETGCSYEFTILYNNLTADEAAQMEIDEIHRYRADGYNVINRYEGGSLGSYSLYSDKELINIAERYSTVSDLRQHDMSTYNRLQYRDLLPQVQISGKINRFSGSHEERIKLIQSRIPTCSTFSEYAKLYPSDVSYLARHGMQYILDSLPSRHRSNGLSYGEQMLPEELVKRIEAEVSLCKTRGEFRKKYPSDYSYIKHHPEYTSIKKLYNSLSKKHQLSWRSRIPEIKAAISTCKTYREFVNKYSAFEQFLRYHHLTHLMNGLIKQVPAQKPSEEIWKPVIDRYNRKEISVDDAINELHITRFKFYKFFGDDIARVRSSK